MKAISICLAVISLALGANADCPLINEFKYVADPFDLRVELFNSGPVTTSRSCVIDIFDTRGNNLYCININPIGPDQIVVINPGLLNIRSDDLLVVISENNQPGGQLGLPLANLNLNLIFDTFYYPIRDQGNGYPFPTIPEWAGQGLWGESDSVYRCNIFPRTPTAWEIANTPNTLGDPNNCDNTNVGNGDPHFIQTILDKKTGKQRNICYDVTGKSGQSIYILKDKVHDIKVEGVLLDDYYMHEIRLTIEGRPMSVSKHGIIYMGKRYEWQGYNVLYLEGVQVTMSQNLVTVRIYKNDRSVLAVQVKRSINKFDVEHLDVNFVDMETDSTRYSGLIGDMQRKEYVISESVQSRNIVEVDVNGKVIKGRLERRDQMECILLSFDSLTDSAVEQYVY